MKLVALATSGSTWRRTHVQVTILETSTSESKPNIGIVRWQWQLISASNIEVLDLEATSFFDLTLA